MASARMTESQRIGRLTPLAAIRELIASRVRATKPGQIDRARALGATLAADAIAPERPARAIALRDGFAVPAAAVADASSYAPVPLTVTAARIDVGGALPNGTDAVLPLDAVVLRGTSAEAIASVAPGDHVLPAGGDAAAAAPLRRAGERVRAIDVAVLAAADVATLTVRAPRICIARGSGFASPPIDAALTLLKAMVGAAGADALGSDTLDRALADDGTDAVLAIGGTGSGRRDAAVTDLARVGEVEVHGIAVSPGETTAFGFVGQRPVLLIPGRLDAVLSVWLLIGRHLVAKLAGGTVEDFPAVLPLKRKVASTIGLTELIPVRCADGMAEPLASGYLSLAALARSDGWIVVPAESEGFAPGAPVAVNPWP
jgi:molybdopterin molybdotransferase